MKKDRRVFLSEAIQKTSLPQGEGKTVPSPEGGRGYGWILIFALACGPVDVVFAQKIYPAAGTSSADFLKIPVGARPIGMGEEFAASSDDTNAVYWNPAGLAGQKNESIQFMHDEYFQGLKHEFFGYVHPNDKRSSGSAWGLSVISLSVPNNLELRSGLYESDPLNPVSAPEGTFGANDLALGVSYARLLGAPRTASGQPSSDAVSEGERQAYGITIKFIRQTIYNQSAQTAAADLGWQARGIARKLDLGTTLQNFGPGVRFGTQYPLPLTLKLGAAYHPFRRMQLVTGLDYPRDDYPTLAVGSEVGVTDFFYLRAGYRYRWYGNPLGAFSGFRSGLGFAYQNFSLDYAFSPFGDLGNAHRISVGFKFGGAKLNDSQGQLSSKDIVGGVPAVKAGENIDGNKVETSAGVIAQSKTPASSQAESNPAGVEGKVVQPSSETATVPAAVASASGGFSDFQVWALPRVVSARGTDYLVQVEAPSDDWAFQKMEFRGPLPAANGLRVQVSKEDPQPALPERYKPVSVYRIKMNWPVNGRSVSLEFTLPEPDGDVSVLTLAHSPSETSPRTAVLNDVLGAQTSASTAVPNAVFGAQGKWRPLTVERLKDGEGKRVFRVKCDNIPEVIAIATRAAQPNPGK